MTTIITDSARTVPFFDGAPMMDGLKDEILDEISGLIDSGRFINGPDVGRVRGVVRRVLRDGGLRRRRERARCAPAGTDRGRPRAGRRGDRPCPDVHRDLRGGDAGGRRRRSSSTSSKSDYNMDPEAAACRRDLAHPVPDAGASLRADGGHAALGLLADCATGFTSSRTRARRTAPSGTACAPAPGARRGVQLLPREESRRHGRRGRARHRRHSSSPTACARFASTARPRSTST